MAHPGPKSTSSVGLHHARGLRKRRNREGRGGGGGGGGGERASELETGGEMKRKERKRVYKGRGFLANHPLSCHPQGVFGS